MKKLYISFIAIGVIASSLIGQVAYMIKPTAAVAARPGGGGTVSVPLGNDVSWPQCGKRLPSKTAFAIIGVNGGNAANTNACLADQLKWAKTASTGLANQDKIQLYVNTANPYGYPNITTWPTSNTDPFGAVAPNPYGTCQADDPLTTDVNEADSIACAWQYGWNRAAEDVQSRFLPAAKTAGVNQDPASYIWWLDVETGNSWRDYDINYDMTKLDTYDHQRNVAVLEGMTSYFSGLGGRVGLYSTSYQWGLITGNVATTKVSNLNGLDSWLAGAASQSDAISRCTSYAPLTTGGTVSMTQFIQKNLDYNYSCK